MTTKSPRKSNPKLAHLYDENGVFYPEEDGVPLPDGLYQERFSINAVSTLRGFFSDCPNVAVSGNTFIYYRHGYPQQFVSPDYYVPFDVDIDHLFFRNTYRVWEMGKIPDFALEIASESTAHYDISGKRLLYAELGYGEYWRYDATPNGEFYGEPLVGERLVNGEYIRFEINQQAEGLIWGHSPTLGLDLCWDDGKLRYRIPDTGEHLPDYDEALNALRGSEARLQESETARLRVESENAVLREQLERLQSQQIDPT
jgi:Uma2 family endonuclease